MENSCPKCGRVLKNLQLPAFCEGCGQHLVASPHTVEKAGVMRIKPAWRVGDTIEKRWEVLRVLVGGMGIVYLVFDNHHTGILRSVRNERIRAVQDDVVAIARIERH